MPDSSDFVVPARIVATGSLLVSLGAVATLAVVVSVNDVDILSTVALALAILAFVVQLIVYVVQSASASQQLSDARTLHGQMMTVLAEIQERTVGTQRSIDQIHGQMIDELRMKAYGSAGINGIPGEYMPEEPERAGPRPQPDTEPNGSRQASAPKAAPQPDNNYPDPLDESVASAIRSELETWPSRGDIEAIQGELRELSEAERRVLALLARDMYRFSGPNMMYGPGASISNLVRKLIEKGLAEKIPGWKLATLTPSGRRLGRVFVAEPPAGTPAQLLEIREEAAPTPTTSNRDDL